MERNSLHKLSWKEDPLSIYTIFSVEDDIDFNTLVKALDKEDAKRRFEELTGMEAKTVELVDTEWLKDFEIGIEELIELNEEGYFIYDSGT